MTTQTLTDIEARALAIDLYREASVVHKLGKVTKADMAVWNDRFDAEGRALIDHCIESWIHWLKVGVQWELGAADRKAALEAKKAEEAARKAAAKAAPKITGKSKGVKNPASDKQVAFILRLAEERNLEGRFTQVAAASIEAVKAGHEIESKAAKITIESLLAAPTKAPAGGLNQAETIAAF